MTRDSAHTKRSRIVDLTAQPLLAFHAGVRSSITEIIHLGAPSFSWRHAQYQFGIRTKPGVAHAQRRKNTLARKLIKRLAADAMYDFAERDVVDVTVNETRAGLITQRLAIESLHRLIVSAPSLFQIEVRSKARSVREQLFDRYRISAFAFH